MKNTINTTNTTNSVDYVEMPCFVGYHAAENGIGMARVKSAGNGYVYIKTCGDDGIWDDDWSAWTVKDFQRNWESAVRAADKLIKEGNM